MTEAPSIRLIHSLQNGNVYGHPVTETAVIETHISWVVLTGSYAYKIKKPVDLGFVDFTTLEKRKFFCEEELRLNRRLAAELYLGVVTITGSVDAPKLEADGEPIEFAVKMRQFPQEALLGRVLQRGELLAEDIDNLAHVVADFHGRIEKADAGRPFGRPPQVWRSMEGNFDRLLDNRLDESHTARVQRLKEWSEREFDSRCADFEARSAAGFVRECHGDMHLGNMILSDESARNRQRQITIFDCIEFNEEFRWIDVLSEVAFVVMDLEERGRLDLARRFLNRYLEITGDYRGLLVLPFYLTYRALVRAKVDSIRLDQRDFGGKERERLLADLDGYLAQAERYTRPPSPALMIAHGVSGSGKTKNTQPLVESLGAVRIRSDIERKRLFGVEPLGRTASEPSEGLYSSSSTEQTYSRLAELAEAVLRAGFTVIADATFLQRQQRDTFHRLANELNVPFAILDFHADEETLRQRIVQRAAQRDDASEATLEVLARQLASREPLDNDEQSFALAVDTEDAQAVENLRVSVETWRAGGNRTPLW